MSTGQRVLRIAHVITGLERGGAELMLERLVGATRQQLDSHVLSLTGVGAIGASLRSAGVPVTALGMHPALPAPWKVLGLWRALRRLEPDLVQTWLYHADLLAGLVARLAGYPVIWNVRQSNLDPAVNKARTLRVARLCARLSARLPAAVVFCSHAAEQAHRDLGYAASRSRVIQNGFDTGRFRPDSAARRELRQELAVAEDARLVGLVGRVDPQKDQAGFLRASATVLNTFPDVHVVLVGEGTQMGNPQLQSGLSAIAQGGRLHLLGLRDDMARIQASLDVAVSSSLGEGMPNTIGEAMACGVPCVVTDVGDSAQLVGETGRVVPPGDVVALADGISSLLQLSAGERFSLGQRAREQIVNNFSLAGSAREYLEMYQNTCVA
ncbi:MAG: glycosyltransferase [Gammaproteobacteria bacterium]|nr:glycosyltransferase [Gammaproteobacteria bacterium]